MNHAATIRAFWQSLGVHVTASANKDRAVVSNLVDGLPSGVKVDQAALCEATEQAISRAKRNNRHWDMV